MNNSIEFLIRAGQPDTADALRDTPNAGCHSH